jgi:hypothetical protein
VEMSLILGRPFLSDTKAMIHVGNGMIWFCIGKMNLMFWFRATKEQFYSVQGNDEQLGEWTEPRPHPKQLSTTPAKSRKTKKVWREV